MPAALVTTTCFDTVCTVESLATASEGRITKEDTPVVEILMGIFEKFFFHIVQGQPVGVNQQDRQNRCMESWLYYSTGRKKINK